jgi:hypothetical protein
MERAIARALANEDREFAATRWSDAISTAGRQRAGAEPVRHPAVDSRSVTIPAPRRGLCPVRRLGGRVGWYHASLLWRIRGALDLLGGGVGLRRGRRDPERLVPGDTLDFWRVEAVEADHLLRLRAEMRLPGRAWLQFEVTREGRNVVLHQTAIFDPVGLVGQLYWYLLWPLHQYVFGGMLRALGQAALAGRSASVAR